MAPPDVGVPTASRCRTNVQLLGRRHQITTVPSQFALLQVEPVSSAISARTATVFVLAEGTVVSNTSRVRLESSSSTEADRVHSIELSLSAVLEDPTAPLDLVIVDAETREELVRVPIAADTEPLKD